MDQQGQWDGLWVRDLAVLVGRSQRAVSHRLRSLPNLPMAQGRKDGKQVFYSIGKAPVGRLLREAAPL